MKILVVFSFINSFEYVSCGLRIFNDKFRRFLNVKLKINYSPNQINSKNISDSFWKIKMSDV